MTINTPIALKIINILIAILPLLSYSQSGRAAWIEKYLSKYPAVVSNAFLDSKICQKVLHSARQQLLTTKRYDPGYYKIAFPNGDVSRDIGVCADVIIRSLREGAEIDLQKEINIDTKKADSKYPTIWNSPKADTNIDHRRVPNLMHYFHRHHNIKSLSTSTPHNNSFKACDIVAWDLGGGVTHIGIVSDKLSSSALPLVIHHISGTPQEEAVLNDWKIIGHYSLSLKK